MADKKLSKKQKKALDFRKKKKTGEDAGEELLEKQVEAGEALENGEDGSNKGGEDSQDPDEKDNEGVNEDENESGVKSSKSKKRQREPEEADNSAAKKPKNRFLLFVGNLPYDITEEEVREHFKSVVPDAIRLRKGFAFVEFSGKDASRRLKTGLRFHHSQLKRRKINVELTAGGGGNSDHRKQKIQQGRDRVRKEQQERANEQVRESLAKGKTANSEPKEGQAGIHPDRLKMINN